MCSFSQWDGKQTSNSTLNTAGTRCRDVCVGECVCFTRHVWFEFSPSFEQSLIIKMEFDITGGWMGYLSRTAEWAHEKWTWKQTMLESDLSTFFHPDWSWRSCFCVCVCLWCIHWPNREGKLSRSWFTLPHQEHASVLPTQTLFSLKSWHRSCKPPTRAHNSTHFSHTSLGI